MTQDTNSNQTNSDNFFEYNECSFSIYPKFADFEPHLDSCYLNVVVSGKLGYR